MTQQPNETTSRDPGEIRLQEEFPLSREEYLVLEEGLTRILARPDRRWNLRLVAGEVFLAMLADYLHATASREDEKARTGTLRHYVDRMTDQTNNRLFQIAAKTRPNRFVRRLVFNLFDAYDPVRHVPSAGKIEKLRTALRLLAGVAPFSRGSRPFPAPDEDESGILMESVKAVVSQGGLLDGPPPYFTRVVRRGYAHLLITIALTLRDWDPRLQAGLRRDALLDAARTVERAYSPEERDHEGMTAEECISRSRLALHLLDSCIHRRDFARSMVG